MKGDDNLKRTYILLLIILCFSLCSCTKQVEIKHYFEKVVEIICENEIWKSFATGIIISSEGLIITNKHVIEDFTKVNCIKVNFFNDSNEYHAEIITISSLYDLALIKVQKNTNYFNSLSENFKIGEKVYSIGNNNGYGLYVSEGIISCEYKNVIYNNLNTLSIQTNIEIYNGCSGGPLFNEKGDLLGIMTFRIRDNGAYIPGMSFAIPTKIINEFLGDNPWEKNIYTTNFTH